MKSKAEWRGILSNYSCCNCIAIDVFGTIMITTFSNKKNAENCRKHHRYRKGRSQMFFKKDVLKNFSIFTGKHLCWSLLLNKWQVFRSAALLKKRLQHSCFPVNIAKFLRTPTLKNIYKRLLQESCSLLLAKDALFPQLSEWIFRVLTKEFTSRILVNFPGNIFLSRAVREFPELQRPPLNWAFFSENS